MQMKAYYYVFLMCLGSVISCEFLGHSSVISNMFLTL